MTVPRHFSLAIVTIVMVMMIITLVIILIIREVILLIIHQSLNLFPIIKNTQLKLLNFPQNTSMNNSFSVLNFHVSIAKVQ